MYRITFSPDAKMDLGKLRRNEPLKGKPEKRWSRQITKKHRLVYRIFEHEIYVEVLSAYGHYDDK